MGSEKVDGYKDLTVTIPGEYRDSVAGHLADADHEVTELDVIRFRLVADLLDKSLSDDPGPLNPSPSEGGSEFAEAAKKLRSP